MARGLVRQLLILSLWPIAALPAMAREPRRAASPPVSVEIRGKSATPAKQAPAAPGDRGGDATYNALLRAAARQSSQGQHTAALRTYEQLRSQYPDDPTVARGYADVLQALGRTDDAERALKEWIERRGPEASVMRSLAGVHRNQNRWDLYLDDVMTALRHPAGDEPLSLSWAMRALEEIAEQPDQASRIEPAVRRLVREESRRPELRILLADELMRTGREGEAMSEVVEADRLSGRPGTVLFQFGEELEAADRKVPAEQAFRRAALAYAAADDRVAAWSRVAELAAEGRRPRAEAEAWREIATAAPKSPAARTALQSLARVQLEGLRDYPGALATLQELEKGADPGDQPGDLYLPMAECQLRLGRLDDAVASLERLKGSKADQERQAEGAFLAAEIHFYRGEFDDAQAAYQMLAENFTRTRKTNDAVGRYLQIAWAKDQKDLAALGQYASLERATRSADTTAVMAAADSLIGRFPTSDFAADALVRKAEMVRPRPGQLEAAIAFCERAVTGHPKARAAPYALAMIGDICLNDLGDRKRGLEAYERLLDQYPKSLLSAEVRRVVEKLRRTSES